MSNNNQQLLDYIKDQLRAGFPVESIKRLLLENDWAEDVVTEAFSELGIEVAVGNEHENSLDGTFSVNEKFARKTLPEKT